MTPKRTPASEPRSCMRCGATPAAFLVTYAYGQGSPEGRLLTYCVACKNELTEALTTVLPLSVLDIDPEATLSFLYATRLTGSNPEQVREMLHLPPTTPS